MVVAHWMMVLVNGLLIKRVEDTNQRFNLNALMKELAKREINNVLIEAGGNFQGDCINAGIVDELWVYIGNHLMGMQFQNDVRLRYRL